MKKTFTGLILLLIFLWLTAGCGKHVHTFGEWTALKAPSCTENGLEERRCSCGEKESREIPAPGHDFGEWDVIEKASKTSEGKKQKTCSVCGYVLTEIIPSSSQPDSGAVHVFSEEWEYDDERHWHECLECDERSGEAKHEFGGDGHEILSPTETETGLMEYVCIECGFKRVNTIPVLPHTHSPAPSWESDSDGHWHKCSGCDEKIDFAEHSFGDWVTTLAATETETGLRERVCAECGYKEEEVISKLPHTHSFSSAWASDKNGHWHECTGCSKKKSNSSHSFGAWVTTKEATASATGLRERTCTVCGYVQKEKIAVTIDDTGLTAWFAYSFTKTDPDRPRDTWMRSYTVYMCRSETENAQIVISASELRDGLTVEAPVLTNKNGKTIKTEILRQYYVNCLGKYYPDPIAPMNETTQTFDLKAGKSQAFFIQCKTDKNTPAGDYSGTVKVTRNGRIIKQLTLTVHVWNIDMPEEMTSAAVCGMYPSQINRFHTNSGKEYYKEYYDFLLDYHMNAYSMPYDVLDKRAETYMNDPRVKFFELPYGNETKMVSYYNKVKTNANWFRKAYFYPFDEPGTVSALNQMAGFCQLIKRLCPGIKIVVPFFQNVQYSNEKDQISFMSELIDIWCPKTFCFTRSSDVASGKKMLYSASQTANYPEFNARMQAEVAGGDELWWYVCWEPGLPYLNMYVDMTGMQNRLLFWQQKQYNVSGFLYWSCNYWERVKNPWNNMATVGTSDYTGQVWLSDKVFGDGSLLYPGTEVGVDGPCASFRLEMIRDGIEEYEMLTMLEKLAGRAAVDSIISTVSTSIVQFSSNENAFENARIRLGNELEAALKKN